MSSEHKILARVPISVRWRDMDSMGHVNNAKYISYLEEARVRWMLGVDGVSMTDRIAPVVAATNVNYRLPIVWPNDIVVELFVERLGNSSVTIGHRIVDEKNDSTLYSDGNVVVVAAGSKAFGDVSLHETTLVDGVSRMRAVERLPIAAGATVELKPGGLHLMLMQPEVALKAGAQLPLRLSLEDGRKVDGTLQVRSALP